MLSRRYGHTAKERHNTLAEGFTQEGIDHEKPPGRVQRVHQPRQRDRHGRRHHHRRGVHRHRHVPLIKLITGGNGTDVAGLTIPVAGTENGIDFGAFISAIINFLIVAWVVFMIVKAFNKMKDGTAKLPFLKNAKGEEVIEHAPTCPFCLEEINVGATRCPHCTAELPAPAEVTIEIVKK